MGHELAHTLDGVAVKISKNQEILSGSTKDGGRGVRPSNVYSVNAGRRRSQNLAKMPLDSPIF
jgi:hypothetical protein